MDQNTILGDSTDKEHNKYTTWVRTAQNTNSKPHFPASFLLILSQKMRLGHGVCVMNMNQYEKWLNINHYQHKHQSCTGTPNMRSYAGTAPV